MVANRLKPPTVLREEGFYFRRLRREGALPGSADGTGGASFSGFRIATPEDDSFEELRSEYGAVEEPERPSEEPYKLRMQLVQLKTITALTLAAQQRQLTQYRKRAQSWLEPGSTFTQQHAHEERIRAEIRGLCARSEGEIVRLGRKVQEFTARLKALEAAEVKGRSRRSTPSRITA